MKTSKEFCDKLLLVIDKMDKIARVEFIDDMIHLLNFERRVTLLSPEQEANMMDAGLSDECRKKLDECKTEDERNHYIEMYARSQYFRQCAWSNYLNGFEADPPILPITTTQGENNHG